MPPRDNLAIILQELQLETYTRVTWCSQMVPSGLSRTGESERRDSRRYKVTTRMQDINKEWKPE